MILDYYLVRVLHQQRLEEALRKEPELWMNREIERSRRSRGERLRASIKRHLSLLLAGRLTPSPRGCAPLSQPTPRRLSCREVLPDEIPCRAA